MGHVYVVCGSSLLTRLVWQWMCLVIGDLNINVHINRLWMTHNDMIIYTISAYIRIYK